MGEAPEPPSPPSSAFPTVTPTVRFTDVAGKSAFSYTSNNDFTPPQVLPAAHVRRDRPHRLRRGRQDRHLLHQRREAPRLHPARPLLLQLPAPRARGRHVRGGDGEGQPRGQEPRLLVRRRGRGLRQRRRPRPLRRQRRPERPLPQQRRRHLHRRHGRLGARPQGEGPALRLRRLLRLRQGRAPRPRRLALHLLEPPGGPALPHPGRRDLLLPRPLQERARTASTATSATGSSRT